MSRFRRIVRGLTLAVTAVVLVGVAVLLPPPWQADDIREAVFRHLFTNNASGLQDHADAYYLAVGPLERDPSDDFIARFHGHKPPVRKGSACHAETDGVTDAKTGERGLLFRVTFMRRVGLHEFEVKGGYFEGGLSGSGNTYRVRLVRDRWIVVSDRMDWIS